MVRAILEGRKTQTRRIILPLEKLEKYGVPGDKLWVRETWKRSEWPTGHRYEYRATAAADGTPIDGPWKSPIYMPREACRVELFIKELRKEPLLAISEQNAIAEGVEQWPDGSYKNYGPIPGKYSRARHSFFSLWDSINTNLPHTFNMPVAVITFEAILI